MNRELGVGADRIIEVRNSIKKDVPSFYQDLKCVKSEVQDVKKQVGYFENVDLQNKEISDVETGKKVFDKNNTHETGNYGEMKTDQYLREAGYDRISYDMVVDVNDIGHQGIDGVYEKVAGHPPYMIVESKYGTSQLNPETKDGKQMSENWIDKRLDSAVGKERADEIRMIKLFEPDKVGSYLSHVTFEGQVTLDKLDANANVIERNVRFNE